jgi:hypothetical protein
MLKIEFFFKKGKMNSTNILSCNIKPRMLDSDPDPTLIGGPGIYFKMETNKE